MFAEYKFCEHLEFIKRSPKKKNQLSMLGYIIATFYALAISPLVCFVLIGGFDLLVDFREDRRFG